MFIAHRPIIPSGNRFATLMTPAAIATAGPIAAPSAAHAAAGTDCLCRSGDYKTFRVTTVRHHRWACDYKFDCVADDKPAPRARPETQTCTAEEIVQQYPTLALDGVYPVLAWVLPHRAEVDAYLVLRRAEGARVRAENERRFPQDGIRERLLARRRSS